MGLGAKAVPLPNFFKWSEGTALNTLNFFGTFHLFVFVVERSEGLRASNTLNFLGTFNLLVFLEVWEPNFFKWSKGTALNALNFLGAFHAGQEFWSRRVL